MTRKLLLGFGALLALLLGVGAVALLVDANGFRPQIERVFAERYDRRLRIEGDLRLRMLPAPAIELPRTVVTGRGTDEKVAHLRGARLGLALWPLLRGRIEVRRIDIAGLVATIDRLADGATSIDDLLGRGPAQAGSPAGAAAGSLPPALVLEDATLTVREGGRPVLVANRLDLEVGALADHADAPVRLAGSLRLPEARVEAMLALSASARLDESEPRLDLSALKSRVSGSVGGRRVDFRVDLPRLSLGRRVAADAFEAELWPTGSHDLHLPIAGGGVAGTADQIVVNGLHVDLKARGRPRLLESRLRGDLRIAAADGIVEATRLNADVAVSDPALPDGALKLDLDGTAAFDFAQRKATMRVDARVDGAALKADLDFDAGQPPRLRFAVQADELTLDRLLSGSAPGSTRDDESHRADRAALNRFDSLSASFAIGDGAAVNDDLLASLPGLGAAGAGRFDFAAGRLDYTLRVSPSGALAGAGGGSSASPGGFAVPVRFSGPFEQVEYEIRWASAVGRRAASARGGLPPGAVGKRPEPGVGLQQDSRSGPRP